MTPTLNLQLLNFWRAESIENMIVKYIVKNGRFKTHARYDNA